MGLLAVGRQAETLTGFLILNSAEMFTLLGLLIPIGYNGNVSEFTQSGAQNWTLTFASPAAQFPGQDETQVAHVGDWVVYSSTTGYATAYNPAQFSTIFFGPAQPLAFAGIGSAERFGKATVA